MPTQASIDVRRRLEKILLDLAGPDVLKLPPDADLTAAIAIDSLALVRLVALLSSTFSIDLGAQPEDLEAFNSVEQLAATIEARLQKQRP